MLECGLAAAPHLANERPQVLEAVRLFPVDRAALVRVLLLFYS